jgi:hypothetical protein
MGARLISNTRGGYQFLPGIAPYSSGVIAVPDHQLVHTTLRNPLPWYTGLPAVREYLEKSGLSRFNLCGVELRCPAPHAMSGFIEFNRDYRVLLEEWDMLVDGENPLARTNVSPVVSPPRETVLHGFSYSAPSELKETTFVVAGGGELPHRDLDDKHIVRFGETSEDALMEKARCVVEIMKTRLHQLGADEHMLSMIDVYTAHPVHRILNDVIMPEITAAARTGVHWYYTRPPVQNIEFEMDMRGVRTEVVVDLQ